MTRALQAKPFNDLESPALNAESLADRGRRSVPARAVAAIVAAVMWLGPLHVSMQQAYQAAGALAVGASDVGSLAVHSGAVRQGLLRWAVAHLPVTVSFGPAEAHAAPISDPAAPVRFTPTISATTGPAAPVGGVPVVNITAPNAQGISLNQYRTFVVDPIGLILNNSNVGGGSFLGGQVGANSNLAGTGPASLIINQVTSQTPAQINGTVEVFGGAAGLVIAAPGGVYTKGAGFTNTTDVTLTTGTPQWLTATGSPTSFDAAAAAGFLVEGGRVQISNAYPGNPNAAGIEGTVGNINLIAESVGIDAALYAGNQINVIAGRQMVAPSDGAFAVSAKGPNDASSNASAASGLAIDATAFGAMTAGQIKLISTATGLGVRSDGNLAASAGNLTIDSAGNVKVGATYAKGAVQVGAAGNVATSGSGVGENGYSVSAGGDVSVGGTLESGKTVAVTGGGSISGNGSVKAKEAVALAAGGSVDVAGAIAGAAIRVSAQGSDGAGDIRLGGDVSSPGRIELNAARDTTIDGSVVSASGLDLSTQRNLTVNGTVGSTDGNVALTGTVGRVEATGNIVSPGTVTVTAGTDVALGGKVLANGAVAVAAQSGSITSNGEIASNDDLTLQAEQNVTVGGQAQSLGSAAITARSGSAAISGTIVADQDVTIAAGQNAAVGGNVSSGRNATIRATNGSATVTGALGSMADATAVAGQDVTLAGSVTTGGNVSASAGRKLAVGDLAWVGGNANLSGNEIRVGSASGKSNVVNGTLTATASGGVTLTGDTQASNVVLRGNAVSNQGTTVATQQLTANAAILSNTGMMAGTDVNATTGSLVNRGTLGGQATTVTATGTIDNAQGLLVGAKSLLVTTGALTSNQGGTLFAGDLTGQNPASGDLALNVNGANGAFNNAAGQIIAGNNLTINAQNQAFDPSASSTGTLDANGTLTLSALAIHNTGTWNVAGGSAVFNATQGITNTGTILKAGSLALTAGTTLQNSGQIIGGSNLSVTGGALNNGGVIHANGDLALNGNVANRGTAEALRNLAITGGDYDNRGGTTQAGGDLKIDNSGTVNNIGSVIGANGNLHIAAAAVINDRTGPVDAGSTTTKVVNSGLLDSTVIGSYRPWLDGGSCDSCTGPIEGAPTDITLGDLMRNPDGSIKLVMGAERIYVGAEQSASEGYFWHLIPTTANPLAIPPLSESAGVGGVPTVDRTIVKQSDGVAGQIIAGGNLDIAAASLSNVGGVVSAGRNVTLNVGSLDNGRSATLVNSVTDTVNQDEFTALLANLASYVGKPYASMLTGPLVYGVPPTHDDCDSCYGPPPWSPIALGTASDGTSSKAPTTSTISYQLGKAGQISAGGNLDLKGWGDLTNAGDLAAAGAISITTPGTFTNRGVYQTSVSTSPGCVAGSPDCPDDSNPHVDSFSWQQTPSTVAAGQSLTIQAGNIQNLNATLAAQGNITLVAGNSVTNASGAIQSLLGDVSINAPTLVNKAMDPAKVHKSYGGTNPSYAGGCNPGGTYGNSQCAADEDVAAGPAAIISGARDVKLYGTSLSNNGALITGGRDVDINMAAGVDNSSIALNADWVGRWQEKRSGGDRWHDTGGRTTIGSLESAIQAGNRLSVNAGGQIANTGNLLGGAVDISGAALINGFTSPTQPTPPSTAPQQVISLGPVAVPQGAVPAATPVSDPTKPWQFEPAVVATPVAPTTGGPATVDWHFNAGLGGNPVTAPSGGTDRAQYLNPSPAAAVLAGVTPNSLLGQLPPELRPGNVSFYYDPYTEGQKLQQAALQQTGQSTFINGLTWDSQTELSITDQQKLILYGNAAEYAKENNIPLGRALTSEQIGALDAPMLWYVEQAVPDPNCNALASTACPIVNALVPQVYLPEGYAQSLTKQTGGTISGENVKLEIEGQIRNSGRVTADDTLTVRAGSIEAAPNVVDIGKSAYRTQGGWNVITGTTVQPGGFMSAMQMDIEAEAIHAVNDAFLIRAADGSVNEAATLQLINELKANLGVNYTEGTVADDIHTQFIKQKKGFGPLGQIVAIVAAVAISIVTAGAGAAMMGVAMAQMTAMQAAMAVAIDGLIAGTLASMASQVITTGSLNLGAALKAGVVSGVTAGLTQGALGALKLSNAGVSSIGNNITTGNWQAVQANLGNYVQASVVRAAISAGVKTVAYGGSFGTAFANGIVGDAAAVGANAIGVTLPGIGMVGSDMGTIIANAAGHALLGCAAQSLTGGDCAGGAIGGAASAIAAPLIREGLYDGSQTVVQNADGSQTISYKNVGYNATTVALATLIGGAAGALLGHDATSAALAAQNESLNNALSVKVVLRPIPTPLGVVMMPMPVAVDEPIGTPNNGPQKSDPLANPLEEQNSEGNVIATPNNGPQGSALTGTPASGPQAPTILGNPGCMLAQTICAGLTLIAQAQDGIEALFNGSGASNAAAYEPLKEQLRNQNLANIAAQDPRLAAAVNGNGTGNPNFSIGFGTAADADRLGMTWVGDGSTRTSDGLGWISADGTRVYRPPTAKSSPFASTGVQANFEAYNVNPITGQRTKISNGHLNVTK